MSDRSSIRLVPAAGALVAVFLVLLAQPASADIQTTLAFATPSTIVAGGSVTVDFGINFIPLAPTTGVPSFLDGVTGMNVASCTTDPNPCTELQFNTSASVLAGPIFAEALTVTGPPFVPTFYPFTEPGTYPITITYPNVGVWQISTAGPLTDAEQFFEIECTTPFTAGVAGTQSCSNIAALPVTGTFNPNGGPSLSVNVVAANAVPEPPALLLLGSGFLGLISLRRREAKGR